MSGRVKESKSKRVNELQEQEVSVRENYDGRFGHRGNEASNSFDHDAVFQRFDPRACCLRGSHQFVSICRHARTFRYACMLRDAYILRHAYTFCSAYVCIDVLSKLVTF